MTTKEFIEKLKENNFECVKNEYKISIYYNKYILAMVFTNCVGSIETTYTTFDRLEEERKIILLDLLYEYSKTPVENRNYKEDKYYLKLTIIDDPHFSSIYEKMFFLNYNMSSEKYFFDDRFEIDDIKTKFTEEEINDLPISMKKHLTKIEVSDYQDINEGDCDE